MQGTVYKSTGSWYQVKAEDGQRYDCRIKGKFRIQDIKSTNPIAVGDQVKFRLESVAGENVGQIEEILPRKNYMVRKAVKLSKQTHIIAANIDQVFLLITLENPTTFTVFIDRFLATAEAYGIPSVLLFNKADTFDSVSGEATHHLMDLYAGIGYTCLEISAKTGVGTDQVAALMKGKTSMFAGHSGVGKSTLINRIAPELQLRTMETSEQHRQGQHTTTFAEMYDLSFDARIIDTPGIKGFGLVDMEKEEIGDYFPEFFALKSECKFNNCLHVDEPKCAVKQALEEGRIAESRYHSYLQILLGEDETYR
ncbi:ribosome small subunit-dependent GTPase A [Robiginitalea sp. M366]|uniref:ribosome small subunit-dependent GTPase A n=1 Tax=Robiginitalea aestuariiviva TaxID=3036903 RepID=UPI00240E4DE9|nr:ribosome small subunit-dependent GTPase A [Robiginitalea aestuariiviva]MDG1570895.1 ribosome small subunit-dependent GTPase A [Robiginitalea aestuariiviva]